MFLTLWLLQVFYREDLLSVSSESAVGRWKEKTRRAFRIVLVNEHVDDPLDNACGIVGMDRADDKCPELRPGAQFQGLLVSHFSRQSSGAWRRTWRIPPKRGDVGDLSLADIAFLCL
jgi:hypothetical protein